MLPLDPRYSLYMHRMFGSSIALDRWKQSVRKSSLQKISQGFTSVTSQLQRLSLDCVLGDLLKTCYKILAIGSRKSWGAVKHTI